MNTWRGFGLVFVVFVTACGRTEAPASLHSTRIDLGASAVLDIVRDTARLGEAGRTRIVVSYTDSAGATYRVPVSPERASEFLSMTPRVPYADHALIGVDEFLDARQQAQAGDTVVTYFAGLVSETTGAVMVVRRDDTADTTMFHVEFKPAGQVVWLTRAQAKALVRGLRAAVAEGRTPE